MQKGLIFRKLFLIYLNLLIFLLIYFNTSTVFTPVNYVRGLSIPNNSIVYDFRLKEIKINRITPDVNFTSPIEILRSTILNSKDRFFLDLTTSGRLGLYLMKSEDEVLSGAKVDLDFLLLNIKQTLSQGKEGEYFCDFNQSFNLSSSLPVSEINPNIKNWQVLPLGVRINTRLQETFSYTDYLTNVNYQDNSPSVNYEIPVEINLSLQILDEKSIPLSGKKISGEIKFGPNKTENINLVSDSQGIIRYTLSDKIKISLSGGRLTKLSDPLLIPDTLYQTKVIDQNNRTHNIWAPILKTQDNPPIVMFWGAPRQKPAPGQRGKRETKENEGKDPRNPDAGVDPINMTMGNVYTQVQDIFIPSKGLPIKFERTYNSLEDYNGVLGFGWTHSYNLNITLENEGALAILMLGDGRRIYFSQDASGNYQPPKGEYSNLVKNMDNTFTWTTKFGEVYNFNNLGKLISIKDRNNNQVTLTYDSKGNLITITSSGGRKIDLSYDSKNRITCITLPNGNTIRYGYDSEDNLISFTDAQGQVTKYKYAPYNLLEVITDPNGHNRYFGYDWYSRGISFSYDYNNHKISLTYDEANKKTIVTDSKGNKTEYYYQIIDGVRLINKIVDFYGNTEEFTWDSNLNRTQVKDKNSNITKMTYDTKGNLLTITDPQGNITTFTYESKYNLVTSIKDALNQVTNFTYDSNGNLKTLTDALGGRTEFFYDSSGQLIKITNPRGFSTQFNYNSYGDLQTTTDALGNITSFDYDSVGNCTSIKDAKGNTTTFEYNANNQLIKITYPDSTYTTFNYDKKGNRTQVKDYLGNETNYEYDAVDRLIKVTDALANTTAYNYDNEGNLISIKDAQGNQTLYEYDLLNRLIKTINSLGIATEYQYDNIGNRTQIKDGNGNIIRYTYDSLNRLTKITYPDASTVEFTYDKLSRRKTMKDKFGITNYYYDALSRLTKVDGPFTNDTITYEYDSVGNRTKMIDQDGKVTTYTYDELNRLKTITDPQRKTTTYNYDAVSNLTSINLPNSTQANYTFDNLNRLLSLTNKKNTG
ncbi:MAG: DUF6531 domain-containing protein, partial [Candidatus Omnitrophica bacterium]|nr:DUF6531 domain-containing protein [Candidatus Omnitrophota bacterium]